MKPSGPIATGLLSSTAALLAVALYCGCAGGQLSPPPSTSPPAPLAAERLPMPAQFAGRTVAASELQQDGSAYRAELQNQRVTRIASRAYYSPAGWGGEETAFAIYAFDLSGRSGAEVLLFDWVREWNFSAEPPNFWVGLSAWQPDRWSWLPVADVGRIPIADIGPFIKPADGSCYVVLLFGGAGDNPDLRSIAVGEEPVISGVQPLAVQEGVETDMVADITGSEPLSYAWDFGSCATPAYSYDPVPRITPGSPGTYFCQLTVTNPMGSDIFGFPLEITAATGEWVHTLGNEAFNYAIACLADAEDNLLLLDGAGLHKFTPDGNLLWSYSYHLGPPVDNYQSYCDLAMDASGDMYISGVYGGDHIYRDGLFVIKINGEGNLIWHRTWAGQPSEDGCRLAADSEDKLYLAGSTRSAGLGWDELLLLKFDTDGQLIRQTAWGSTDSEWGEDIAVDSQNHIYVSGYIHYVDPPQDFESVLLKFSSAGELLAQQGIDGTNTTRLAVNPANDHVFMALKYGSHSAVLEFNSGGARLWSRNYVHSKSSWVSDLLLGADGQLYLCGAYLDEDLFDKPDSQLLKCSLTGVMAWGRRWDNNDDEERLDALALGPDGSLYLAGAATNVDGSWQDITLDIDVVDNERTVRNLSGALSTPVLEFSEVGSVTTAAITYTLDAGGGNRDTLCFRYLPD